MTCCATHAHATSDALICSPFAFTYLCICLSFVVSATAASCVSFPLWSFCSFASRRCENYSFASCEIRSPHSVSTSPTQAGWQPIVYSNTAARLLKAAWCLLRIATPCAVLRRLTVVAGRPAAHPSSPTRSLALLLLPTTHFHAMTLEGHNRFSFSFFCPEFAPSPPPATCTWTPMPVHLFARPGDSAPLGLVPRAVSPSRPRSRFPPLNSSSFPASACAPPLSPSTLVSPFVCPLSLSPLDHRGPCSPESCKPHPVSTRRPTRRLLSGIIGQVLTLGAFREPPTLRPSATAW